MLITALLGCQLATLAPASDSRPARTAGDDLVWLADSVVDLWPHPERWRWSWGEGICAYGLLRAGQVSGDAGYGDYVARFLDAHIDAQGELDQLLLYPDRIAPGIATLGMLQLSGDARYAAVCDRLAEWLMFDAPRAREGGWLHFPVVDLQYVDTLFMTTVFLAGYGRYLGRDDYVEEALRQHQLLAGNLYSESAALYWHGWDQNGLLSPWATPWRHHNDAFWGRGNGWAVAALARVLEIASPSLPEHEPARRRLESCLERLFDLQDSASGHWWTVVDRPDGPLNYTETTATALIVEAAILAARAGLAPAPDREQLRLGIGAIRARLFADDQGRARVVGASIGTNPSGYWGYVAIPTWPDRKWGVGASLLLLAEVAEAER